MRERGSIIDAQIELKEQVLQEYKRLTGSGAYRYWYENYYRIKWNNDESVPTIWENDLRILEMYEKALREGKSFLLLKSRNTGDRLGRFIISSTIEEREDKCEQLKKLFYTSGKFSYIDYTDRNKKPDSFWFNTHPFTARESFKIDKE